MSVSNVYSWVVNITHRKKKVVNKVIIIIPQYLTADFKLTHPLICLITFYRLPDAMGINRINHWDHAFYCFKATSQLLRSENRDIDVTTDKVLEVYFRMRRRRIDLVL